MQPPLQAASSLLVLVCTYNERENIANLVDAISRSAPEADILVIDDSSPDKTSEWVASAIADRLLGDRLHLIIRQGKRGLGSAIKEGLLYSIEHNYERVVNLDGDFSHNPTAIPTLIAAMDLGTPQSKDGPNKSIDLVIGSRYVEGGGLENCSWKRKLVSMIANRYANFLLRWNIHDCSSAYRCYRVDALRGLPWEKIECEGYGFLEEILWFILHATSTDSDGSTNRHHIIEVPILYTERVYGNSKISWNEALGTLAVLHKLRRSPKRTSYRRDHEGDQITSRE